MQKKKASLLLSLFTVDELIPFFTQNPLNKTQNVEQAIKRWQNGNNSPGNTYGFWKQESVKSYLNQNVNDKEEVIDKAFNIITKDMGLSCSKKHLEEKYNILFIHDKGNYDELVHMKNYSIKPYYSERNEQQFLDIHFQVLEQQIGQKYSQIIRKRLLSVDIACETFNFPSLNLLPSGALPYFETKIVEREQVSAPHEFIDAVSKTNRRMTNGTTFAIDTLNLENGGIHTFSSCYFNALFSCDRHFFSIATYYPGSQSSELEQYKNNEHLKNWAHSLKKIVVDNDWHSIDASIGISCLTIYKTKDGYESLLIKKNEDANGMNDSHVIPSLMAQPLSNNPLRYSNDLSIKDQVVRELAEELFGYDDEYLSGVHPNALMDQIYGYPEIQDLENMMKAGTAEFHITGLYLDMYRLRPEVTTVLIVHDTNWYERYMITVSNLPNSEAKQHRRLGNWEIDPEVGFVPIDLDDRTFIYALQGKVSGALCPPGAAAYITGYQKFKSVTDIS